jgi:hypothetical protein
MSRSAALGTRVSQRPANAAIPRLAVIAAAFALLRGATLAAQPVAGQNINMVSGTTWPGGDPFLQRQNEPSLAVSSRNPQHLLAGANDYRTVDLPVSDTVPGSLAGDAWLGVFKSFDGGLSWQSYLLSGYPQDKSAAGLASPLKAYSAAADPTVRAGVGGLFYYSGIAFNRGTNNGAVFVSTFFDANSKENGNAPQGTDTIPYVGTVVIDTGTSGQFLDKTWIAVDVPRGTATCTFNVLGRAQNVPAGNVYLAWSRFTGSQSTKIMVSRSQDCGKTWSNPIKVSESSSINQGTNIAIDPLTGQVYVVWRQFATTSNPDSILMARSDDFGNTFPSKNTTQVATIIPFDQTLSSTRFRTNALPSVAISAVGNTSRVHVAWAQRKGTGQDAQIVVSTSSNSGKTWSTPVPVDADPLTDDNGGVFPRGHQFMPQLTFAAGRLMVLYYDQRLDHTIGLFKPMDNPFLGVYKRTQLFRGELLSPGGPAGQNDVFSVFIDDDTTLLTQRRHTVDLRVARALPSGTPTFTSASVSQYRMGLFAPDSSGEFYDDQDAPIGENPDSLYQLQVNVPNLPMFSLGTLPFMGDYIDIAGQTFVTDSNGKWVFNTSSSNPPIYYATWTDNRDVVPPPVDPITHLVDWSKYTPPISATNAGDGNSTSVLDSSQKVPACNPGTTGSRNQNIYLSRITEGLLVGSPQDAKPLSATLQRAFVVTMQNQTSQDRTFTLTLVPQSGVWASFLQAPAGPLLQTLPVTQTLIVTIPARAAAARPVFAFSSNPAGRMTVSVVESGTNSIGLSGTVVLNPEGSVPALAQPDGTTADIGSLEIYTPSFQIWNPANPNPYVNISNASSAIQSVFLTNADPAIQNIANQNIANQNIANDNISNQNIANPSPAIQNIANQNIANQNIANTTAANQNIANQNIANQNIANQNIANTPITDATYAVTNTGNTAHSYRVALYGNNTSQAPLQVIVTKNSSTPVAVGCTLQSLPQSLVLSRADAPPIATSLTGAGSATDPNIPDSSSSNATVAVGPGETVFVTLRGAMTSDQMALLTRSLTPVITAHGANTNGVANDFAALLFIQTGNNADLPAATVGNLYSQTLTAAGGKGTLTWSPVSGFPSWLSLSAAGVLSGTPNASGSSSFTVQVTDSSAPQQTATQTFNLTVNGRKTATSVDFAPKPVVVGQATSVTVTVTDNDTGTQQIPAGNVNLSGNPGLSPTSCALNPAGSCQVTLTPGSAGTASISASYQGSATHEASASGPVALTVNPASTTLALSASPNPSVLGQSVTLIATVSVTSPGAGTPTGTVTFKDGATTLGTVALSGGTATFSSTSLTAASHSITASYGGDGNFAASASGVLAQIVNMPPYTFIGFNSPLSTAGVLTSPTNSGTGNFSKGLPIKWQLKDSLGNFVTSLTSTQMLRATYYTGGACTPGAATGTTFVLYLPTSGATGGSTFRYDSNNNQFLFNWSTKSVTTGAGCYEIILQLNDGSAAKATQILLQ